MLPGLEAVACPDMAVSMDVMQHVVNVESSRNPFAIGVVGGTLVRQPRHLDEALATVRMLEEKGYNFSVGLAQVNRYNLARYGLESYERAFQICPNLQAGARILAECYSRSGNDWGKSFSCYYSGNFETGFRHGYVQKIFRSIDREARTGRGEPIAITGNPRRVAGSSAGTTIVTSRIAGEGRPSGGGDGDPAWAFNARLPVPASMAEPAMYPPSQARSEATLGGLERSDGRSAGSAMALGVDRSHPQQSPPVVLKPWAGPVQPGNEAPVIQTNQIPAWDSAFVF
jgi:Transglycosylase SLT domain.